MGEHDHVFKEVANLYSDLVARYGHDFRACDWGSRESQLIRFRVLSEVGDLDGMDVLDVGCGVGHFYDFLVEEGIRCDFHGIDISSGMVDAARETHPDVSFEVANVLDLAPSDTHDYVFANGIFGKFAGEGADLMHELISHMFVLSSKATAFTSLSTWAPSQDEGEFHADPVETLAFCRTLTEKVVLRHDYHPRDFTIYLYKEG